MILGPLLFEDCASVPLAISGDEVVLERQGKEETIATKLEGVVEPVSTPSPRTLALEVQTAIRVPSSEPLVPVVLDQGPPLSSSSGDFSGLFSSKEAPILEVSTLLHLLETNFGPVGNPDMLA
ncbi:hypothetical protein Nepgr_029853 [Nepenthes gracilis]|uniref:Uncharacterized protein n=1 Tax=Nepenthes gracilis TaxID=150966 RepID=A0AAD3TDF4_NEPGR|nr:hypothetical protein Nepgr_029853 [Nepenthes gracilis]